MSPPAGRARDPAVLGAGLCLLLTAAATAVMVYARVSADADQSSLLESLRAIAANKAMYSVSGAARLISGATLVAGALFLWRTWVIREGFGTLLVPCLFAVSGVVTAVSGAFALALAASAPGASEAAALLVVDSSTENVAYVRWLTGKMGFAAAGLALLAAARRQWGAGGAWRRIAPASALIGVGMQFIWVDAATVIHRITGPAFFAWLVVIGVMLLTDKATRRLAAMRGLSGFRPSPE